MNSIVAAIPAAILGWVFGWLSAWATDWPQPPEEAKAIRRRSPLVRDPLVQSSLAVIWAAIPFVVSGDVVRWLEAGVLSVPLVQIAVTDLRTRYVYTVVALVGLGVGLLLGWHYHGVAWYWSVIGGLGGAVAFLALYGIGRLVYRGGEPMARGDITIASMVGAGGVPGSALMRAGPSSPVAARRAAMSDARPLRFGPVSRRIQKRVSMRTLPRMVNEPQTIMKATTSAESFWARSVSEPKRMPRPMRKGSPIVNPTAHAVLAETAGRTFSASWAGALRLLPQRLQ